MVNFYHHFVLRAVHLMRPLYKSLKDKSAKLTVSCHQLRPNERKYSTFNREILGLSLAVHHLHFLLEAHPVTAFMDHRPLTTDIAKVSELWSAHQQWQLFFISEFTTDIQHVTGKDNAVANNIIASTVLHDIDYIFMAADQASDLDIQAYRTAVTGFKMADVSFDSGTLLCNVSTGQPRPIVPSGWRRQVFNAIHGLSHPGRKSQQKLVAAKFRLARAQLRRLRLD
ncbi:hypothetical protein AAFF_G00180440 [Aldrovandia affinis]|uniref:Reverse transcriptase RNase H-like domain-containing protein n=1 Tax=Aldrovandia affinis TaxID=143900 RepID=A0AAD7SYA8_9TELE|nr:hypothetical protein AAFF_G00180440 [Aldrovandia affinis]